MANINGTSNGDFIQGTGNADVIDGLGGNDFVVAGNGDDQVYGRDGHDLLDGGEGNDILDGGAGNDDLRGQGGADLLDGGDGDDRLDGGSLDTLRGGAGNDQLIFNVLNGQALSGLVDGGDGIDNLNFGNYTTNTADIVFSLSDPQARQVIGGVTIVNVEQASFISGSGNDILIGGHYYDELTGGGGSDVIDAGGANDRISGGAGVDILRGGSGDDEIFADVDDKLVDGGSGVDRLNLNRIDQAGDVTLDLTIDTDQSIRGITVRHIERLDYRGGTGVDLITAGDFNDFITGGAGDDVLRGGGGSDVLDGHGGIDQLFGGAGDDTISSIETTDAGTDAILDGGDGIDFLELSVSPLGQSFNIDILTPTAWISGFERIRFTGGFGSDNVSGGDLGDVLQGRDGNDVLNGRDGDDYLAGDNGDDTLDGGEGHDYLIGGAGIDRLIGGDGDDRLDGVDGSDTLIGGRGNDTYTVVAAGVTIVENAGEGIDLVMTSLSSFNLEGTNIENLSGQFGNQVLTGNAFANRIDGGSGADEMAGGAGDDTYVVDNAGDVVRENAGDGKDTILTLGSYILAAGSEIESVQLLDDIFSEDFVLVGNAFAQEIVGNSASNSLYGGGGRDLFRGLGGNDYYVVDSSDDAVLENADEGTDFVFSTVDYVLQAGSHVEVLAAYASTGTAALMLTGNALANTISGNAGSNSLYGGGGTDTFMGLAGNDYYVVDSGDDIVIESAGDGTDFVFATADYGLQPGSHVEVLAAYASAGTTALRLTGNELANVLAGNAGYNLLNGGGGADQLTGGGAGDQFFFDATLGAGNVDTITDFVAGVDSILLENGVFTGLSAGSMPAGTFRVGTSAQDADDRIIYDAGSGALFFDADGLGGVEQVQFATLSGAPLLTASDLFVI